MAPSGILELRLAFPDEGRHAFLHVFGLEGQRVEVGLDLEPLVDRRVAGQAIE
jgi:hypothetical protein